MSEIDDLRNQLVREIMNLRHELAELRGMSAHFMPTGSDLPSQPVYRLRQMRDHLDFCVTNFDTTTSDPSNEDIYGGR
jgi:hypothetical protein